MKKCISLIVSLMFSCFPLFVLPQSVSAASREIQVQRMARFCPQCGAKLSKGARFCPSCGSHVADKKQEKYSPLEKVVNELQDFLLKTEKIRGDIWVCPRSVYKHGVCRNTLPYVIFRQSSLELCCFEYKETRTYNEYPESYEIRPPNIDENRIVFGSVMNLAWEDIKKVELVKTGIFSLRRYTQVNLYTDTKVYVVDFCSSQGVPNAKCFYELMQKIRDILS